MMSTSNDLHSLVLFARHGAKNQLRDVDAPISDGLLPLGAYSNRSFQHWFGGVKPGELTPHTYANIRQMAQFLGEKYSLPCSSHFFADSESLRDVETAEIFAEALGCDASVINSHEYSVGIFNDVPDAPFPSEAVVAQVGSLDTLPDLYSDALGIAQRVLGCCEVPRCESRHCSLDHVSNGIDHRATDRPILGSLGVASYVAELVQMAHCSGVRTDVSERELRVLLGLVELQQGIGAKASGHLGAELLSAIWKDLKSEVPRTSIYFGHDTNIQFLRALLHLEWRSEGWAGNLAEPMSLLAFESYLNGSFGLAKIAATPSEQMAGALPTATSKQQLWIPGCTSLLCTPSEFRVVMVGTIRLASGSNLAPSHLQILPWLLGAVLLFCVVFSLMTKCIPCKICRRRSAKGQHEV
eukprot:CAMPEP_0194539574 /NCGR_PEP_ID=MMETSP0253-20130528/79567_1 /TAXON_ID=2966 /ORGANISM="Noctiluca scintillans" /LENGTH=410 /DNA_ID=CAMNT_0039385863 /DNA_START=35 /DNA_END=1267 /DNA_ORIENTATION=+